MRFIRTLAIAALVACGMAACSPTAQNTKQSLASEQATARKLVAQLEEKNGLYKDRKLNSYLGSIVNRVAKHRPPGSVPLQTYIIRDADVNAFTVGGGYVFFNAGMIAAMETPVGIGRILTMALPFDVRPPRGRRQVFSL